MRRGFTFVELLLAGGILGLVAFGAIIGIIRISGFVEQRAELMAADGYCWDVAWKLFNEDYDNLKFYVDNAHAANARVCEVKGRVLPKGQRSSNYEFLSHLQFPDSPPVCYVTLSNAYDTAGKAVDGICIGVNLEWGPVGSRRILMRRSDTASGTVVFNHPVEVFRSNLPRIPEEGEP